MWLRKCQGLILPVGPSTSSQIPTSCSQISSPLICLFVCHCWDWTQGPSHAKPVVSYFQSLLPTLLLYTHVGLLLVVLFTDIFHLCYWVKLPWGATYFSLHEKHYYILPMRKFMSTTITKKYTKIRLKENLLVPWAIITKYHGPDGSSKRKFIYPPPWGWKSEINMSSGGCSPETFPLGLQTLSFPCNHTAPLLRAAGPYCLSSALILYGYRRDWIRAYPRDLILN